MNLFPLANGPRRRKLRLDADTVRRYRMLAAHEGLSVGDAIDLALREALERRSLPEEPTSEAP